MYILNPSVLFFLLALPVNGLLAQNNPCDIDSFRVTLDSNSANIDTLHMKLHNLSRSVESSGTDTTILNKRLEDLKFYRKKCTDLVLSPEQSRGLDHLIRTLEIYTNTYQKVLDTNLENQRDMMLDNHLAHYGYRVARKTLIDLLSAREEDKDVPSSLLTAHHKAHHKALVTQMDAIADLISGQVPSAETQELILELHEMKIKKALLATAIDVQTLENEIREHKNLDHPNQGKATLRKALNDIAVLADIVLVVLAVLHLLGLLG